MAVDETLIRELVEKVEKLASSEDHRRLVIESNAKLEASKQEFYKRQQPTKEDMQRRFTL